ncbi:MAG: NUDIX domain-containing protein [Candidatus Promineifilaceae bacterium]
MGNALANKAQLRVGCSAIIFDPSGTRILLTQRTDNGRWCLPGGGMDSGESASEAIVREVREETGLQVVVDRLAGIYTTPHRIVRYADGNEFQFVAFSFVVQVVGGELGLSDETTAYGYFTLAEMANLDVMEHHIERIEEALAGNIMTLIR